MSTDYKYHRNIRYWNFFAGHGRPAHLTKEGGKIFRTTFSYTQKTFV